MQKTYNSQFLNVFNAAKKAIKNLGFNLQYSSRVDGLIEASSSGSFLSWGEDIQIKIEANGNHKTRVEVNSTSKAQLFSWGTNDENEKNILEEIKNLLR